MSVKYSKIEGSDDPLLVEEESVSVSPSEERRQANVEYRTQLCIHLIAACSLCVISFFLGTWSTPRINEVACVDTAWDHIRQGISFESHEFNPRFVGPPSQYMGPPNSTIDRLWYDLAALRNFGVTLDVLDSINRSRGAVRLSDNDGYQVGLEAFHQLHCLNYIRMYTYMDYYEIIDYDMKAESLQERRDHADHCVEMLRQRLMCTPDMNIYTYHWVARDDTKPWGNLFSRHRCIDWDRFYAWAQDQTIKYPAPSPRPQGADLWD